MQSRIESNNDPSWKPAKPWQLALSRFFDQAWVEVTIGVLVLVSVGLTLAEFWLEMEFQRGREEVVTRLGTFIPYHVSLFVLINDLITLVFAIELAFRYMAARSKRKFFGEFWLDIIAILPLFRVFRSGRAFRLLRLVRLLRILGVIARLSGHFPYIVRRGAVDFLMICGMILLAIVFGTLSITHFESRGEQVGKAGIQTQDPGANTTDGEKVLGDSTGTNAVDGSESFGMVDSFWFSVYTLFAGEPIPDTPRSLYGKVVTVFLMFMGMTIFAIFAGTVSAFMVDRMRVEGRVVEWDTLRDHIVICGWTPKTKIIIKEYRASAQTRKTPIVVITELTPEQIDEDVKDWTNLIFIHDDFTKVNALERAGIANAKTCLVLTDTTGGRSEQDADARTILASLTAEKINSNVYTCAELVNRSYATHLETGRVNDFVVSGEYGAHMLAQAAMNRGLITVLSELLTYERGNEFHCLPIPTSWVGRTFDEKLTEIREKTKAILFAVHSEGSESQVNPVDYKFQKGDEVVLICHGQPKLS